MKRLFSSPNCLGTCFTFLHLRLRLRPRLRLRLHLRISLLPLVSQPKSSAALSDQHSIIMPSTLSLSDEHGSYLQGLHHNSVRGRNIAPISSPHKHHGSTPSTVLSSMPFSEEKENATAGQEDLSSLASPTLDENGQVAWPK